MDSRNIIESIGSIYDRFRIPAHLQEHMLRAAAVGKLICRNWVGEGVNEDDIVAVLLLHDLGNVVRMGFDNEDMNDLYGEKSDIEELREIREEMIEKYGSNDHEVTFKMCREIGVSEEFLSLMGAHIFVRNRETCVSDDFDVKVCAYADQRIGPRGVLGLRERLDDAIARGSKSLQRSDAEELVECALKIEEQVLSNMSLSAEEINDDSIKDYFNHINS